MLTVYAKESEKGMEMQGDAIPDWRKTFKALEPKDARQASVIDMLITAAKKNDLQMVKCLVAESKINPNSRNEKGWTALLRAAKCDSREVIQFLVRVRADVDTRTKEGNTPMHKAAKQGHAEVIQMLLQAHANPDVKNKGDASPLMLAAMHKNNVACVQALIDSKANVNMQKDVGYSALMLAARFGNSAAVAQLLMVQADMELQDSQGETALQKAWKHRKDQAAQLLIQNGAHQKGGPPKRSSRAEGSMTGSDRRSSAGYSTR
eukprot:TRINITY_DN112128_c0_g1_i1.p1 TRINITY_DN112128_c0_g1~~TRINITY_DN112128_c0_g1_i1.p1  ORF type:complete len:263 (+),score=61.88 TRINITY_DN112128_c0_g1_i1:84-872(+)